MEVVVNPTNPLAHLLKISNLKQTNHLC